MAVDTASKRYSAMQWGSPELALPEPDGVISRGDRLHLMCLYGGIEAASPTIYNLASRSITPFATFTDTANNTDPTIIGPVHFNLGGIVERLNLSISLSNGTAIALSSFIAEVQINIGESWIPMQKTWGDTGDKSGFVVHSPDDLENLAHGATGVAILNPVGFRAIRFKSGFASAVASEITRTIEVSGALKARNR